MVMPGKKVTTPKPNIKPGAQRPQNLHLDVIPQKATNESKGTFVCSDPAPPPPLITGSIYEKVCEENQKLKDRLKKIVECYYCCNMCLKDTVIKLEKELEHGDL